MKRQNSGLNMPGGQGAKLNINPDDLVDILCEKCGCQTFQQVYLFKSLSAVLSPNGNDSLIPLQIFECKKCGHVNKDFIPNQDGKKIM